MSSIHKGLKELRTEQKRILTNCELALSNISMILMSNNGLNKAQIESLRRAKELLT